MLVKLGISNPNSEHYNRHISFKYYKHLCIKFQRSTILPIQYIPELNNHSKILLSLTKQYFTSDESIGERSTCIVAFCVFLLIAMMVLIVSEHNLEVGVDPAYDSFYENASKFLENQGLSSV